jgi:ribosomal protein S18 acetylase RimI-like enzyme
LPVLVFLSVASTSIALHNPSSFLGDGALDRIMQQASLLSYFSKSVASAASGRRDHVTVGGDESHQARGQHSPEGNDLHSLGIVGAIREQTCQASTIFTTLDDATPRGVDADHQTKSDPLIQEPSKSHDLPTIGFGIGGGKSAQFMTVAHLPEALISPVQQAHLPSIQRLTATTLPVRYGDAFFSSTVTDPEASQLSRVVLYASEPVGWIRCRLESCSSASPTQTSDLSQIYIQALALLAPYRNLGLATTLLDAILASPIAKSDRTVCLYAHVWEKNEDALLWYEKRGFKRVLLVDRYYRRLRPGGAWIVRRERDDSNA